MCRPNSSRGIGPAIAASGYDGAQTVTICTSHKCCLSMVPGLSSGTSVIVTANAHVPSRTKRSPPCMVVMRRLIATVGRSACRLRRHSIRCARGKYVSTAIETCGTPASAMETARVFISSVREITARASGRRLRPAAVSIALRVLRSNIHIKGTLECLDRVTDRRLCTVQLSCRPGKASLVTHGNEGPKLIDSDVVEHTYLKSRCYASIFGQL